MFQEAALLPWATVLDNVRLPLKLAKLPKRQALMAASEAIAHVGLTGFKHCYPRELSGGMKMRVSIALVVTQRDILLTEHHPLNLFQLYRASRWQTLLYMRLLHGLPYFLAGLRISVGLALIGAVVAEFVAGTGGTNSGLTYQILMSGYNLQIPRIFATLLLITLSGIAIFTLLSWFSNALLKNWHESVMIRDN